ncbi:plasmid stabilization protein [Gordonia sp. CPCC 205515]|uniref:FitA-like ribbon-helix-helix domain-containing protein n=1 Tax=Gordonia sp. CPCC 205515 TaxID=3140791 RepID=UPI003AF3386B
MATLTIRDLDDDTKAALRLRAARNGRSMEAEVRMILRDVLGRPLDEVGMGTRIRRRFAGSDTDALELPERRDMPQVAEV